MRFHDLKNIYSFVFVILLLSSQFFSLIGTAVDSDNLVEANFDRNRVRIELSFRVTEQGASRQIILYVDSAGTEIE